MASKPVARSGEASKRLTAATLAHYGPVCWLALPGCTQRATTKDHVIAVAQGGTDAMENLRPACHSCNSKRRDMSIGGVPGGILVTFHVGPVAEHRERAAATAAQAGDIVLAHGLILAGLTPGAAAPTTAARHIAHRAFTAAMQQALRIRHPLHVRIAHPVPTVAQLQTWARLRYFIDVADPGRAEAERIAAAQGREAVLEAARWYDRYPEGQASVERTAARRTTISSRATAAATPAASTVKPSRAW